ncbi:MAG: hypothetical protein Q8R60_15525 [Mycobacteriales bacterium]|nr:hypothetical protein [Mycobacteriales bacterium]
MNSNKVLLVVGGTLMTGSIVMAGVFAYFVEGRDRVLVVTMKQGVTQTDRDQLRADCGGLPGVEAVADRGNPDPDIQRRFPVRFVITGATPRQEAALEACVEARKETVRGFLVDGDR